jgi:hypothetical protein
MKAPARGSTPRLLLRLATENVSWSYRGCGTRLDGWMGRRVS